MSPTTEIQLSFAKDRETKNTIRFEEQAEEPIVGTLYVKKTALETISNPDTVTVTVTAG